MVSLSLLGVFIGPWNETDPDRWMRGSARIVYTRTAQKLNAFTVTA